MATKIVLSGISRENITFKKFVKDFDAIELAHPGLDHIIDRIKNTAHVPLEAVLTITEESDHKIYTWSWVEITIP